MHNMPLIKLPDCALGFTNYNLALQSHGAAVAPVGHKFLISIDAPLQPARKFLFVIRAEVYR